MFNRTKIIATIGKKTLDYNKIRNIVQKGATILRYNFSHGNHEDAQVLLNIRERLEKETSLSLAIIGDIAGPEVRISNYNEIVELRKDQIITIYSCMRKDEIEEDAFKINIDFAKVDLKIEQRVLLMDGQIEGILHEYTEEMIKVKILNPGKLRPNAHCAIPGVDYPLDFLTEKDKEDIAFCIENNFDGLALSFVKNADDIRLVRKMVYDINPASQIIIIAKFELPQSISNMDEIMTEMDACFVARGDLALETEFCMVPIYQKMICKKASEYRKPVFIATQMLETMLTQANPSRAELSDVANAVFDSADALTLSSETAINNHAAKAVEYMNRIIFFSEESIFQKKNQISSIFKAKPRCNYIVNEKNNYVILYHASLEEIRQISALRPNLLIYVVTDNIHIYRICNFYWGIIPIMGE